MQHQYFDHQQHVGVAQFFAGVFGESDGRDEGELVGQLAATLCRDTDDKSVLGIGTYENQTLVGGIFFSVLEFDSPQSVFLLSPVAVSTQHQRQGVGQSLIRFGLDELVSRGVDVVVTYGDPAYYSRVGFQAVLESELRAPYDLSMPYGWQAVSLSDRPIPTLRDRPVCVDAFNDASLW